MDTFARHDSDFDSGSDSDKVPHAAVKRSLSPVEAIRQNPARGRRRERRHLIHDWKISGPINSPSRAFRVDKRLAASRSSHHSRSREDCEHRAPAPAPRHPPAARQPLSCSGSDSSSCQRSEARKPALPTSLETDRAAGCHKRKASSSDKQAPAESGGQVPSRQSTTEPYVGQKGQVGQIEHKVIIAAQRHRRRALPCRSASAGGSDTAWHPVRPCTLPTGQRRRRLHTNSANR